MEQLEDALFELCDLWCPSISESEYVEFFEILEYKIKYVGQNDPGAYDLLHWAVIGILLILQTHTYIRTSSF